MRFCKLPLLLLSSTLCLAAQPDRIASPIDSSRMATLPGHVHPQAQPQYDKGLVEPTLPFSYVTLVMAPSPSQQKALDQLLAQQQDRSSPNFHKWLTPKQYADRFGLSQKDINQVTNWLEGQGFQIISVGGGRNSVVFSGTAAQIQNAFATEIHRYSVKGEEHVANSTPLSVPAALHGVVTGVRGLNNFLPKPMYVRALSGRRGPHPSYTTTVQGSTEYFMAPGDVATMYNLNPLYTSSPAIDGTGQKLAIVGQTDVYLADITDFRTGFGLNAITGCTTNAGNIITACSSTNFRYVAVGSDPGTVYNCGDLAEADLDIEWSGATARNAQIIFVNAPVVYDTNCNIVSGGGVVAALAAAINPPSGPPLAPVISMSYGACESQTDFLETELQQGNAEGVTIMNSAGDTGSAACDNGPPASTPNPPFAAAEGGLGVNYPASSPEVTGVGGTSIPPSPASNYSSASWGPSDATDGGSLLQHISEAAWNDDEASADFCISDPTNSFCNPNPGVKVTSAQTYQEDYWISEGGGGVSNCFNQGAGGICESGFPTPTWQQGITIPTLTSPQSTYRFVPDVSLLASPNYPGYIICTPVENLSSVAPYDTETTSSCANGIAAAADGVFSGNNVLVSSSVFGGTSVASPIFAGIVALLNQSVGGTGLGNINQTLYTLAANPSNGVFHPVTSGDNNVYCEARTPAGQPSDVVCPAAAIFGFSASNSDTTTGYNLVTGLGSVDANALALALKPDFQLMAGSLTPATVAAGGSASATLTIQPITGSVPMVVNFSPSSCTGLPTGATCSFNPPSVVFNGVAPATTAVTISTVADMALPAGAQTITIVPTNSTNITATISLTVTKTTESFTLSSTATTFPISVGGTAKVEVTVSSTTGFVNTSSSTTVLPLTYSCSGIPTTAEISCQVSNNGQPSNATTVTVSLVTTPVTTQLLPSPLGRSRIFYALLLPGLFGVVWARPRWRGLRMLGLISALAFSTLWLGACGGSKNSNSSLQNTGTPAGNYSISITGTTGGANPITNNVTVILAVSAQ